MPSTASRRAEGSLIAIGAEGGTGRVWRAVGSAWFADGLVVTLTVGSCVVEGSSTEDPAPAETFPADVGDPGAHIAPI
jgi:hypothetical protein